ncbi:MAG: hypothetical protein KJ697_01745 [Nanoarchaeota archaeon]|nr:hypothetical protein [Nanoarchaeota archaeon]MBU4124537.1 hypothetical protein [Nanoarchaeota archaeon]
MHIEVLENTKEKVRIELTGENSSLSQVIATAGWAIGGEIAAVQEHPFTEQPKLISCGSGALKNLEKATNKVINDCEDLEAEVKRALKK